MPRTMSARPAWDKLSTSGPAIGVDRVNNVLRGYVVAQTGRFKDDRGQFDNYSLMSLWKLMREKGPLGLRSRFTHPTMSSDGLGTFLGRARDPWMDGNKLRANLHFDPSAFTGPKGNLAGYVMDLAASDPDALSSSVVLQADKEPILDASGRQTYDTDGEEVPPLWRPTELLASDIVDTGAAVDGLLSAGINLDALPLAGLWKADGILEGILGDIPTHEQAAKLKHLVADYLRNRSGGITCPIASKHLDPIFAGQPDHVVASRLDAWAGRHLEQRDTRARDLALRLRAMEMRCR